MEQWKRVVIDGIEWNYEVSTWGNVRNVDTEIIIKRGRKPPRKRYKKIKKKQNRPSG